MPWFIWALLAFFFLVLMWLSWPIVSSSWWDTNINWIESNQKRLNFFTYRDERLERILAEVAGRAQEKGFPEHPVLIRMIKPFVITLFDGEARWFDDKPHLNRIYIASWRAKKYSDDDLRILIAHELGHIIDGRTKKIGHPVFEITRCFNEEQFADFVALYLYPGVKTSVVTVNSVNSVKLST